MHQSVLSLGEKIVLAARLASIEHVRQELDALSQEEAANRAGRPVGDRAGGFKDESEPVAFTQPVPVLLGDVFRKLEKTTVMPRATKPKAKSKNNADSRKRGAA